MKYDKFTVESTTYKNEFWDKMMKGYSASQDTLAKGNVGKEMLVLPYDSNKKYNDIINNESIFRKIATNIKTKDSDHDIWISDSDDTAEWALHDMEEIKNVVNDFTKKRIECHSLSIISRIDEDIVHDSQFDIEDYLVKQFSKSN